MSILARAFAAIFADTRFAPKAPTVDSLLLDVHATLDKLELLSAKKSDEADACFDEASRLLDVAGAGLERTRVLQSESDEAWGIARRLRVFANSEAEWL